MSTSRYLTKERSVYAAVTRNGNDAVAEWRYGEGGPDGQVNGTQGP